MQQEGSCQQQQPLLAPPPLPAWVHIKAVDAAAADKALARPLADAAQCTVQCLIRADLRQVHPVAIVVQPALAHIEQLLDLQARERGAAASACSGWGPDCTASNAGTCAASSAARTGLYWACRDGDRAALVLWRAHHLGWLGCGGAAVAADQDAVGQRVRPQVWQLHAHGSG